MGVGSFGGGFNTGMAFMTMNAMRRGGGGYDDGDDNGNSRKKFSWIWFSINVILFSVSLSCLICISFLDSKYSRECELLAKHQSEYVHKSKSYPEYYFTVRWKDREKEKETFEVTGETYFSCKEGEIVYFSRTKEDYLWTDSKWLALGFIVFGLAWLFSALGTILKD